MTDVQLQLIATILCNLSQGELNALNTMLDGECRMVITHVPPGTSIPIV